MSRESMLIRKAEELWRWNLEFDTNPLGTMRRPMTEVEWPASTDPAAMLEYARHHGFEMGKPIASDRKLRLWCDEVRHRFYHAHLGSRWSGWESNGCLNSRLRDEQRSACEAASGWAAEVTMRQEKADLLRHILGNPFRPWNAVRCGKCFGCGWTTCETGCCKAKPEHVGKHPAGAKVCLDCCQRGYTPIPTPSFSATVLSLAETLYAGQDCAYAIHDALLDCGAPEALIGHFRESKGCPKGCWTLDVILKKE